MMKKLIFTLVLLWASTYTQARATQNKEQAALEITTSVPAIESHEHQDHTEQQKTKSKALSNYGSLVIGWGPSFLMYQPTEMNLNYWSSRHVSGSIYYNFRLGRSNFTISPGIGISSHIYTFENKEDILARDETSRKTVFKKTKETFPQSTEILGSSLGMRYCSLLLEARFNYNSKNPKTSFFAAIGGDLCWLWHAFTKVAYQEDNMHKKQSNAEFFNLDRTLAGFHIRLGWGRFGLCYKHIFPTLFEKDMGPDNNTTKTFSIALSVDLL